MKRTSARSIQEKDPGFLATSSQMGYRHPPVGGRAGITAVAFLDSVTNKPPGYTDFAVLRAV